jgi:phage terminase small subunit
MSLLKNAKHEAFAIARAEGKNQVEAYRLAGYTPHAGNASALDKKPDVAARIEEIRSAATEKALKKAEVTVEKVIAELAKLGFANMLDYIKPQPDGTAILDLSAIDRDKAAAIHEYQVDTVTNYETNEDGERVAATVKRARFKLADKRSALVDLGKHLGMFRERVEVEHSGHVEHVNALEELTNRLEGIAERGKTEGRVEKLDGSESVH